MWWYSMACRVEPRPPSKSSSRITGIPTLAALRLAVEALEEMDVIGEVQLIIAGGIRTGADVAKALAMGADAVSIGQGVLMALGCNRSYYQPRRTPRRIR